MACGGLLTILRQGSSFSRDKIVFLLLQIWKSKSCIPLVIGVVLCIAQHVFYTYLDGKELASVSVTQTTAINLGNGLATLIKTAMVTAIAAAFAQRFWYCAQRKTISVATVDAIFALLQDPLNSIRKEVLLGSKVLCVFAAISWSMPLSAIFAPGALTGLDVVFELM
jgi:hypothetical protein